MNDKALTIVRLEVSRIKRITGTLEIVPSGPVVTIKGNNGEGKSSCLDAIEYVLGGKDTICERPINDKSSRAQITADLGDFVVQRKFTTNGAPTLTVKAKDGSPIGSPQTFLDGLSGKGIGFDPLSFVRMDSTKQLETLRKLVGVDFTVLNKQRDQAYEERKIANRELVAAKAKLNSYQADPTAPTEETKVADLMEQLKAAQKAGDKVLDDAKTKNACNAQTKSEWENRKHGVFQAENAIGQLEVEIKQLEELLAAQRIKLSQLRDEKFSAERRLKHSEEAVAVLKYIDLDEIRAQNEAVLEPIRAAINRADEDNTKFRNSQRRKELVKEVDALEDKVQSYTDTIDSAEAEKRRLIEDAKFPISGLSFNDSGVLLDGHPFNQGSQAQQIIAAVSIGFALSPKIKVILIREGSLLDDHSLAKVTQFASDNGGQVWIESVKSDDPGAIEIIDGGLRQ